MNDDPFCNQGGNQIKLSDMLKDVPESWSKPTCMSTSFDPPPSLLMNQWEWLNRQ